MKLSTLKPEKVFGYFEQICSIPHGSYNTDKIADYVVNFAKEHNLEYSRDEHNNVIIKKDATEDYNGSNTVIIQGHLDMVCAKEEGTDIDFDNEGLDIDCDGEYIFAKGTTLGGDDGIAVAMALAILDSDTITHPNFECVFTTDEEVGMLGANAMDMSNLKGKYMLNIDSEDEGEFTVSCAGGETLIAEFSQKDSGKMYSDSINISISNLTGGHSGAEINKGRANAIILMGTILGEIKKNTNIEIIDINGGQKDNAIAVECSADISTNEPDAVIDIIEKCKNEIISKYSETEKSIQITASKGKAKKSYESGIIDFLANVGNGVRTMSSEIEGLVQTSSNLGIIRTESGKMVATFSLRSSLESEKKDLHNEIIELAALCGGSTSSYGKYPAWEYRHNSKLQSLCKEIYKKQYNADAKISAIHAGLECGIFCSKIKDLDCISFGPNILDIHTVNEKLEIASVQRVYGFLTELLSKL